MPSDDQISRMGRYLFFKDTGLVAWDGEDPYIDAGGNESKWGKEASAYLPWILYGGMND